MISRPWLCVLYINNNLFLFSFYFRDYVCIMLKRVIAINHWWYFCMDFQNFGFVGAIKSQNFQKTFGIKKIVFKNLGNLNWIFFCSLIRTIALDMRGYNLSERPTESSNYKISYMVEDLRALIEHLSMCILWFFFLRHIKYAQNFSRSVSI